MQSSFLGLQTAIYKVPEDALQEAKAWYSKAFNSTPYFDEPYYVGFTIGGCELGLQAEQTSVGQNVAVFWGVTDIEGEYNRFLELGAVTVEKPISVGDEIMVATVTDPWNNMIGLIYNPHHKGFAAPNEAS